MDEDLARQCWARAAQEELGIIITMVDPTDVRRARDVLYRVKAAAEHEEWEELMVILPGDAPKEIMLIKKTTDMTDVPYTEPTE